MKKFLIENIDDQDTRIDKWLKKNFSSLNQSFIEKNLRKENIKVNNCKVVSKYKLQKKERNFSNERKNIVIYCIIISLMPNCI